MLLRINSFICFLAVVFKAVKYLSVCIWFLLLLPVNAYAALVLDKTNDVINSDEILRDAKFLVTEPGEFDVYQLQEKEQQARFVFCVLSD